MRSIGNFLKEVQEEFPDAVEGKSTAGGFDGPPLPEDRQYRARISRGEWRQSQAGKYSFAMTFEILEPEEFAGRKFTEYYSIAEDAHPVAKEKFARFIGESGVDQATLATLSHEEAAEAFEDVTFVIATRVWGEENDNTGIRYLNRDRGQALQEKIAPPKSRGGTSKPLRPDINVRKDKGPFEGGTDPQEDVAEESNVPAAETPPTRPPVNLPGSSGGSGVTLPPGLRRQG